MPAEAKPIFRPEVLSTHLQAFELPEGVRRQRVRLEQWAERMRSPLGQKLKEQEILHSFMEFLFIDLLGYRGAEHSVHTFSREKHVEVDGTFADAVLGRFGPSRQEFVIVFEGKSPSDPLERPYKGRRLSAVQQAYQYAINLPCDWIIASSIRETRLYFKGSDQQTYERFRLDELDSSLRQLEKLVFLLGAERCLPDTGRCHLYALLEESEQADRELTAEFYQRYTDIRYESFRRLCSANPGEQPKELLSATQKLLDRILFCAFCEDRGLLPSDILRRAYETRNPFVPNPVWDNFKNLFRFVDEGNAEMSIPAYDGGLFREDRLIRSLEVPDEVCAHFRELGEYDYHAEINGDLDNNGRQVDVEILGHIFEQSITDLELLYQEIESGKPPLPQKRDRTRRQKEGAFYTPRFVTRYIVDNTLGRVLEERFEALRREHQEQARGKTAHALEDPRVYDLEKLKPAQKKALRLFWEAWHQELGKIRILDPACGSGAFLLEAFDHLYAAYQNAAGHLEDFRGQAGLFDVDRRILQNSLYGVDINHEAVEICRLSLWIKTAKRGRILTSLDHTIRVGNSIVDDPQLDARAFDFQSSFPEALQEAGGFDVVLGNPPYIRQELLKPIKKHLKQHYDVYHGMADLYVYFFERGLRLLRPGGRLSFVVTNKWLRASYGRSLRAFLAKESKLESVVDLGHAKEVFPDADVFPSITVLGRRAPEREKDDQAIESGPVTVSSIPPDQLRIDDLQQQVDARSGRLARSEFGEEPWLLDSQPALDLIHRMAGENPSLAEFAAEKPYRGILTGFNEAFLIDGARRKQLIHEDPKCEELIQPYVRGQDIKRWHCTWPDLWIITLESSSDRNWPWSASERPEAAFQQTFPSIYRSFIEFEARLQKRQDQGDYWWELRSCSYWDYFEKPKILYQEIQYHPRFAFDDQALFTNNKAFFLPSADLYLLGVLNSPLMWWHNWRTLQHLKDEALSPMGYMMEKLPIAEPDDGLRGKMERRVRRLIDMARERDEMRAMMSDWLRVEFEIEKLGSKLQESEDLSEDEFVAQVQRRLGKGDSLTAAALKKLRSEHARTVAPIRQQEKERLRLEREVSDLVCQAYRLTEGEKVLIRETAPPRTPLLAEE
ncbi:MAG TPA: N-6 DNA methylase [Acidobacteriota bacterium]|nr:N-6 DNA methylase [Acidobacteriota bacterium]